MNKLMLLIFLFLVNASQAQTPLTNTFTYQGELKFDNALANGSYDFEFSVFDLETGGSALEIVTINGITVINGVFSTPITLTNDLFTGNKIWLDIAVRANGTADPFDPLSPRQEVSSSPYAIHAQFVGADAVTGVQIDDGTITASDINTSSVQVQVSGVCASGFYMQSINTDGSVVCAVDQNTIAPAAWRLGGNFSNPGDFIGTNNSQPFVVKVKGLSVLELQDAISRNIISGVDTQAPNIIVGSNNNISGGNSFIGFTSGATISGGRNNLILNNNGTIGGGVGNEIIGSGSIISGGIINQTNGSVSTISGGRENITFGSFSTISGGNSNQTNADYSTVSGGLSNQASGYSSTVSGGAFNQAGGDYSLSIGKFSIVRDSTESGDADGDEGTFVWSDATATGLDRFTSTGPNQFLIRATGGVGIGTNNPNGFQLNVSGDSSFQGDLDINGIARIPLASNGLAIGSMVTNGNALNILGSSYFRNDGDTSTDADLILGGGSSNASDDGVLTSDLSLSGSDLFIKSNDAVLVTVDANNDGDAGRFEVRSTSTGTLLEVQESGVVNIPGSLNITGNISKGGGTFKIDHPLDPKNKYLYHSFVESPDMMNVYNGNITTDKHGEVWVELPEYFEALNRDFRYQLTVIRSFSRAMVAEEITDNQFLIKTDEPNIKVSWQITGIRQDAYAEKNRIQVEVDKPTSERGSYLYPAAWENDELNR